MNQTAKKAKKREIDRVKLGEPEAQGVLPAFLHHRMA